MKIIKKRILSAVLGVIIVLSAFSSFTFAVSAASYGGKCGANVTWSLDTSSGVLTVSGTGDMGYPTMRYIFCIMSTLRTHIRFFDELKILRIFMNCDFVA